mmetsp:Transcript_14091/g.22232  ORF Transcript_14091/g.22232 Transcript_14091/m.22232 type:complete len:89 (+) Transcript_14091:136-402(+)
MCYYILQSLRRKGPHETAICDTAGAKNESAVVTNICEMRQRKLLCLLSLCSHTVSLRAEQAELACSCSYFCLVQLPRYPTTPSWRAAF